jgi:hypothetical protein
MRQECEIERQYTGAWRNVLVFHFILRNIIAASTKLQSEWDTEQCRKSNRRHPLHCYNFTASDIPAGNTS